MQCTFVPQDGAEINVTLQLVNQVNHYENIPICNGSLQKATQ